MIIHVKKTIAMKKTYITPTLWVEKIQLSQFVCVSGTVSGTLSNSENDKITDVGQVGAKGGWGFLTDDEPEEADY